MIGITWTTNTEASPLVEATKFTAALSAARETMQNSPIDPRVGLSRGAEPANLLSPRGDDTPLTHEQFEAGLSEARRIINQSAGYYFGGELTPFAEPFKSLALRAIAQLENPVSASGDDEELSKALEGLYSATRTFVIHECRGTDSCADAERIDQAEKSVESLFGRIREERDRLEAECLMELLHEPTGKMLPVRVRTVVQALEAELGRIREELKEASKARDTYHAIVEDYIRIASVEECAEAVRAWRAPK